MIKLQQTKLVRQQGAKAEKQIIQRGNQHLLKVIKTWRLKVEDIA